MKGANPPAVLLWLLAGLFLASTALGAFFLFRQIHPPARLRPNGF